MQLVNDSQAASWMSVHMDSHITVDANCISKNLTDTHNTTVGTIYLVSTPIGNLGDITLRALETLRSVSLIAAEDTRHTRKLLSRYDIHCRLLSYNEHSPPGRLAEILQAAQNGDVAFVTDAGTPAVSDPGRAAVLAAVAEGIPVTTLPGASAVLSALVLSGLPAEGFMFLGFLPRRPRERARKLGEIRDLPYTLVLFEAPHRLVDTLQALEAELGDRPVAVARELTKIHEEVRRSTVAAEVAYWRDNEPRGEFALVVGAGSRDSAEPNAPDLLEQVEQLVATGVKATAAVRQVSREAGVDRKELYARWLDR